jgi:hypothetical protein
MGPRATYQHEPDRRFWGTIQNYITLRSETEGTYSACEFVPDDRGKSSTFAWHNLPGVSYQPRSVCGTRCTWDGQSLQVMMLPERVRWAAKVFARVNKMSTTRRTLEHALEDARENAHHDGVVAAAGWAWDDNHMLHRAMPPRGSRGANAAKRYPCTGCGRVVMKAKGRPCSRCRASRPTAPVSALSARLAADGKLRKMVALMLDDGATTPEAQAALTHARRRAARPCRS